MRLVLLGPPGAGKGTQAEVLSKKYKLLHISTGELLRNSVKEGSDTGKKAKAFMDKGELVPDVIVIDLVLDRIKKSDAVKGFILDGFPRNQVQAESLNKALALSGMPIDYAIDFETSESTIIKRLTGRRVCRSCGRNYHIKNIPSKKEGICDSCGGELYERDDDKEETIKRRLEVYRKEADALVGYYKKINKLCIVSGDLEVNDLQAALDKFFKNNNLV